MKRYLVMTRDGKVLVDADDMNMITPGLFFSRNDTLILMVAAGTWSSCWEVQPEADVGFVDLQLLSEGRKAGNSAKLD